MKKIQTAHSYKPTPGWSNPEPSITQPGMIYSIRQIRERFQRGQGITVNQGIYNPSFPAGYEKLDKVEKAEFALQNQRNIDAMRRKLQAEEAKKKADEAKQKQAVPEPPPAEE